MRRATIRLSRALDLYRKAPNAAARSYCRDLVRNAIHAYRLAQHQAGYPGLMGRA